MVPQPQEHSLGKGIVTPVRKVMVPVRKPLRTGTGVGKDKNLA